MLTVGVRIDGHSYVEEARWTDCIVHISKCERCDRFIVGWQRTGRSRYAPYADEQLSDDEIATRTERQLRAEERVLL